MADCRRPNFTANHQSIDAQDPLLPKGPTMSLRTLQIDDHLFQYVLAHPRASTPRRRRCAKQPERIRTPACRSAPTRASSWPCWSSCSGARRTIEIGTFTGYSALAVRVGPARRRPRAGLRRQRRIHAHRPAVLAAGRRRAQDRAEAGAGAADARRAAGRRRGRRATTSPSSTPTRPTTTPTTSAAWPVVRVGGLIAFDNMLLGRRRGAPGRGVPTPPPCRR